MGDMAGSTWRVPARVETRRLVLRCYSLEDVAAMDEVIPANREHLEEFMEWARSEPIGTKARTELVEKFIAGYKAGTDFTMGIFTRDAGEYIGGTGYHVRDDHLEIGYWLAGDRRGHGIMTEAAAALTRVALQFAFSPFVAICCEPANERSKGVPRRLGYAFAGMRELDGVEHEQYRLSSDAFLDSAASAEPRPAIFDALGSPLAWPQ